jgi:hypothetical protein
MENPFYIPQGQNSAPIKPFIDLKDKLSDKSVQDHYLNKQIREKYETLMARDKQAWREKIIRAKMNALFIQGEQVLHFNTFTGLPVAKPYDAKNINDIRAVNRLQKLSTEWQAKWFSSRPDVLVEPLSTAFDEAVSQARKANRIIDHLERTWYYPRFRLHEGLMAQISGWYGREVQRDYASKAFSQFKEIVEDIETPIGKGYGKCDDCGYTGEDVKEVEAGLKPMNACPKCDSVAYEYDAPIMQIMPRKTGEKQVFLPEIKCSQLNLFSTRFDLAAESAEKSSYLIVETEISEAALHRLIGNIRFPEGQSADNFGLEAIQDLARRGVNQDGSPSNAAKKTGNKYTLSRMYLGPDDLWDIKIGGDEKTVEGNKLPKGKRMSEVYPDGAYLLGVNGFAFVAGIFDEHHSSTVSDGTYHLVAMSSVGRGVDDPVQTQRQVNRFESQKSAAMAQNATPATLIAEGVLDERAKKSLNDPRAIIPVKMQNWPNARDPESLVRRMTSQQVGGDFINEVDQHLLGVMQDQYHVTPFSGGNPRVKNDTATGARLLEQNFDDLFTPCLATKAFVDLSTAKKGFYMWCEANPFPRFIPFKSQSGFGEEISGKDVKAEYDWSYVEGSEAPKTKTSKLESKVFFYSQWGGIANYLTAKQQLPEEVQKIERDFDMDNITDVVDEISETCRVRWEAARKIMEEQMQGQMQSGVMGMDYLAILADVDPSMLPTEPKLDAQAKWFQDLLMTEEGRQMTDEERDLVSAFIICLKDLFKGQTIQMQQDAAEIQMAAQAPMLEAQAAQQQEQVAAEQQGSEQQMMAEVARVANENEQAELQRQHATDQQDEQTLLKLAEMENQRVMQSEALKNAKSTSNKKG